MTFVITNIKNVYYRLFCLRGLESIVPVSCKFFMLLKTISQKIEFCVEKSSNLLVKLKSYYFVLIKRDFLKLFFHYKCKYFHTVFYVLFLEVLSTILEMKFPKVIFKEKYMNQ